MIFNIIIYFILFIYLYLYFFIKYNNLFNFTPRLERSQKVLSQIIEIKFFDQKKNYRENV